MNSRSLLRNWFGRITHRRPGASQRYVPIASRTELLEARTTPTGNVSAQLIGDSLYLFGDEAANSVELTASGSNLVLRGLDNTTVNGQSSDFLVQTGSLKVRQSLFAFMGGGDDTLALTNGAHIRRDAYVYMGEGNDSFAMNTGEVHRHLNLDLGGGNDSVSLDGALVSRHARIFGGLGDKLISINNSTIGRTLTVVTTTGNDNVVIDSSSIGDDVVIATSLGDDNVVIDNSKLRDYATVDTSLGDDFVQISPTTTISDNSFFFLGAGNDNIVFDGANTFRDDVNVFGQGGTDNVEAAAANTFRGGLNNNDTDGSAVDDAVQTARITATSTGAASRAEALRAALATTLTPRALQLALDKTAIAESAGANAATGTVTRPTGTVGAILVTLASSATDEATVPATVTIPAGQNSVTFAVTAVDDTTQDGNVDVTITATAKGYSNATAKVTVEDTDVPLTLELSQTSVTEGAGSKALTGTVTRTGTAGAVTINLASSDTSEVTVPATVTIEDGKTNATFDIAAVEDTVIDGKKTVTITASGATFVTATKTVDVTDNEVDAPALTLALDKSTVSETDGSTAATATVTRNTEPTEALTVNLSSGNTTVATVPTTVTIPAGKTSVTFAVTAVDDQSDSGNRDVTLTAAATGLTSGTSKLTVTDNDIAFDLDTSANTTVESSGTLITKTQNFTVAGKSVAGAKVELDIDGDGFDDGTQTADGSGAFSMVIPLTHTDTNNGANALRFRATTTTNTSGTIEEINVHRATGSVVQFPTNIGTFHAELLDADAPLAVANFKGYFNRYTNLLVQRSPADFVIQAGRFTANNGNVTEINRDATIQNEFNAKNGNVKGTLSMALPAGQPNAGSSEWFINVVDNSFLNSAQHTVFGRVIGDGMDIVEAINAFPIHNLNAQLNNGALGEVPLIGNITFENLAGTVSVAAGSTTVTGTGTTFLTDLEARASNIAGTTIKIGDQTFTVASIQSNTQLTLSTAATTAATAATLQRQADPAQANYIVFSQIGEVLNTI